MRTCPLCSWNDKCTISAQNCIIRGDNVSVAKLNRYVWLGIGMSCLQCGALLAIPFADIEGTEKQRMLAYAIGALFWLSIIGELVLLCLSCNERKRLEQKRGAGIEMKNSTLGIFSFLRNREAIVADVMLFISVILLGIVIWTNIENKWIIIVVVSILVLSFNLHSILNGRNYIYLKEAKNNKKEKKRNE